MVCLMISMRLKVVVQLRKLFGKPGVKVHIRSLKNIFEDGFYHFGYCSVKSIEVGHVFI